MQRGIGVVCALFICRLIGYNLFVSALFGAIGLGLAQMIFRMRIKVSPYAFFVLIFIIGLLGEIITALSVECENQENFYAAWLFFVPTLFFLFLGSGRDGAVRKIVRIAYAIFLMLMHFYAKQESGDMAALSFLPMQLSLLFASIYSLKQKNGAL